MILHSPGKNLIQKLGKSSRTHSKLVHASEGASASGTVGVEDTTVGGNILRSMYKFTRPHTIRGTILASCTGVARALIEHPTQISLNLVPRAVLGLVALLMGNAYIVGINQIFDVDVDKVNKPFLPIAAGELTKKQAWMLVAGCGLLGPLIAALNFGGLILGLYLFGLVIGTLYSVPPFQTKRFPIIAGLTIACVRGFLLNFGVYYAVKQALNIPFQWNASVIFLARFMTVFAGVIAITKDLPDVEGDRKYNINTLTVRKGVPAVAKLATGVLLANYISAIVNGIVAPAQQFNKVVMVSGHALFSVWLIKLYKDLNASSTTSVKKFYKGIWDLFYAEYCLYPFI
eukprot:CAMPEP_0113935668 /NCGR_PEP_ID=MMETSP1339-20121228/2779_1 /TAXON_ID=94617 /ORGANISM="Fibrocapsa japonica" /LENGTH=343 /DNA_ID=CAMNT_0000937901 /DNA_START=193 /DNA_END=1224 /DNA_ORIENTATION=- /assembly_acc=CAM_ASM_000762